MKGITGTLLGLTAMAVALGGCVEPPAAPTEDVRSVRAQTVTRSSGVVESTYPGEVRARYESRLGFKVAGKIALRLVEVGDRVVPGQALMRLDPQDAALSLAAAAAQTEAARIKLRQSDIDLARYEQLQSDGFVARAALDQYRLAQETAASQLRSAEAQQRLSENQQHYTILRADRAGVVTAIEAEVGQVVSAGQGVLTVAGDGEREVLVSIPESRIDELRGAARLTVSTWVHPERRHAAALRELAPDTDKATRTYSARVRVDASGEDLRLGMTATVRVEPDARGAVIRIPLAAVQQRDGRSRVWVIAPGSSTLVEREVDIAEPAGDSVSVTGGLTDGEVIVTAGGHLLQPGQKVRPVATARVVGSVS